MGKAERNRQQNARQRIAYQQAAARKAEARRRIVVAGSSALAVVVIVVGLIVVKTVTSSSAKVNTAVSSNQTVAKQLTSVPATVLDKVGVGPSGASAVAPLKPISSPALTLNGKPEVLYIGAEYCPYCAAERWAMVQALSRFGTFKNLGFIHSTSNDVYSNTSTLTFYKSSYTSKYLSFKPLETFTVDNKPLQKATTAENTLLTKYGQGSFPFVDIDGKYIVSGSQYLPSVLGTTSTQDPTHFGLTWAQIGKDLQNPSSPVAQAIIGAANHITAAICSTTNDQPSNVCKSTSVTSVGGNI
jgi:thiol-disulfide isomerase/thioredoxin